jgi:hypothetical protein
MQNAHPRLVKRVFSSCSRTVAPQHPWYVRSPRPALLRYAFSKVKQTSSAKERLLVKGILQQLPTSFLRVVIQHSLQQQATLQKG